MCESHVNDAVRRTASVKSAKSDRHKNETVVIAEHLDTAQIIQEIQKLGYDAGILSVQPYEKVSFFEAWKGRKKLHSGNK